MLCVYECVCYNPVIGGVDEVTGSCQDSTTTTFPFVSLLLLLEEEEEGGGGGTG